MFVTPDVDCTARNISERHKITYKWRLEKGIKGKNKTRILLSEFSLKIYWYSVFYILHIYNSELFLATVQKNMVPNSKYNTFIVSNV
jgi:hypothetical protein